MSKTHMCLDVKGAIRNRDYGWFTNDDGTPASEDEALDFLLDHVAQGHRVIPIGECDNFDWQKGWKGHATPAPDPSAGTN
jgi:hypothetical protein